MINKMKDLVQTKFQRRLLLIGCILLAIVLIIILMRVHANRMLKNLTEQQAIPVVSILKVTPGPVTEEIILPGNVQAWHEAIIYARTNGYIKQWYVDIGSRVKAGDLLALIETPEVDAQLRQAEADLRTAQANYELAKVTAKRWVHLLKTDSVSKQETDEKVSAAKALLATVNSMQANRDRLAKLVSFERVTAPFDGIISSRTTDVGSLIDAGSNAPRALFRIVQNNPLRIYVRVPQYYIDSIKPHMQVTLHFNEHPGKSFKAKLFQTANAIDYTTRTLLAQFVAQNNDNLLLPGGYAEVHLKIPMPTPVVRLPNNTLLFRYDGLRVATVGKDSKVVLRPITISRDFGITIEVSSGIQPGDNVIINPSDAIFTGQLVHVVPSPIHDR